MSTPEISCNEAFYPTSEFLASAKHIGHETLAMIASGQRSLLAAATLHGLVPESIADPSIRTLDATLELSERLTREYPKPEFGLHETVIDGETIKVTEEVVKGQDRSFGSLLHFNREVDRRDPKVLLVAPMSGHYSTLLRDTVRQLLPSHDVYITDWKNARDVPVEAGEFGLDEYADYIDHFMRALGRKETNLVAVCQATVPVFMAAAHLAATKPEAQPMSMTLMGGPLDACAAPTSVTKFAESRDIEWFARNLIARVPHRYAGKGRLVYPGQLQLSNFMAMNPELHGRSHWDMYSHLVEGDTARADKIREFYDEYFAVADLSGEFYLDTVKRVFMDRELARGVMQYKGTTLDAAAITDTSLLTIEGGRDDISAPGQTTAVHDWCVNLPAGQQFSHLQAEVGHYGIFNGKHWAGTIAPTVTGFIRRTAEEKGWIYEPPAGVALQPKLWQGNGH
jgi:poly(3-hydroxybutyrate) depolymerase